MDGTIEVHPEKNYIFLWSEIADKEVVNGEKDVKNTPHVPRFLRRNKFRFKDDHFSGFHNVKIEIFVLLSDLFYS